MREGMKVSDAIEKEEKILAVLRDKAEFVVDTSGLSPHQLGQILESRYSKSGHIKRSLYVHILSFGFKHGQCWPLDSLFDVRFLKNPHFGGRQD